MNPSLLVLLLLLPTAGAVLLPDAPSTATEPRGAGCPDTPLLVDECGDQVEGDLFFPAASNLVLDTGAAVAFDAGALTGDAGEGLRFGGKGLCVADTDVEGCGDITTVSAASGLVGGGKSGEVTLSIATDGIARAMLQDGAVGAAEVDPNEVQLRVKSCPHGTYILAVSPDGMPVCETAPTVSASTVSINQSIHLGPKTLNGVLTICHKGYGTLVISGNVVVENPYALDTDYAIKVFINGTPLGSYVAYSDVPPAKAGDQGNRRTLAYTVTEPCFDHKGFVTVTQELAPVTPGGFRYSANYLTVQYVER